ncbi:hypothetical protein [Streptomyces sp. NPDC047000]|uniref:hypothetical protein n=1 Tax=Streptomyces sp. NPDC047000 TaxID=3155474 RepID=UPI0033E809BE
MLALRLSRCARPAVQLRRLLVTAASAGTAFLLLCVLGDALGHPQATAASALRLAWCGVPLAATVYLAVAVARTDPGTRPRPGLSAIGLGPGRLMAVSATTTALSGALGSAAALLCFLQLRGDLTGRPFTGAATAGFLATGLALPVPGAVTLLALPPVTASLAVALVLRPRERRRGAPVDGTPGRGAAGDRGTARGAADGGTPTGAPPLPPAATGSLTDTPGTTDTAGTAGTADPANGHPRRGGTALRTPPAASFPAPLAWTGVLPAPPAPAHPYEVPRELPWGIAVTAAGLAVEAYAGRAAAQSGQGGVSMPGGLAGGPVTVLVGWVLTVLGLALAGPGLTYLSGRLLQVLRPGALRLLGGRVLMAEAHRIGRPLGVVCAVAAGGYAMSVLSGTGGSSFGPLTLLGALVVSGCAVATLLTAAVEARLARADSMAALLRLGAPVTLLRGAAALRAGALLALFGPLTALVAALAALPLTR